VMSVVSDSVALARGILRRVLRGLSAGFLLRLTESLHDIARSTYRD
jgi:hypothetical protein